MPYDNIFPLYHVLNLINSHYSGNIYWIYKIIRVNSYKNILSFIIDFRLQI